jgi:hypothetical protein
MSDAAGIIGYTSPSDYALSPVEHAEQLRTSAPKLAALLTSSAAGHRVCSGDRLFSLGHEGGPTLLVVQRREL